MASIVSINISPKKGTFKYPVESAELKIDFGIVDLSLAPTPKVGDSIGEIIQILGMDAIGAPGSTAAVAMLNESFKEN